MISRDVEREGERCRVITNDGGRARGEAIPSDGEAIPSDGEASPSDGVPKGRRRRGEEGWRWWVVTASSDRGAGIHYVTGISVSDKKRLGGRVSWKGGNG